MRSVERRSPSAPLLERTKGSSSRPCHSHLLTRHPSLRKPEGVQDRDAFGNPLSGWTMTAGGSGTVTAGVTSRLPHPPAGSDVARRDVLSRAAPRPDRHRPRSLPHDASPTAPRLSRPTPAPEASMTSSAHCESPTVGARDASGLVWLTVARIPRCVRSEVRPILWLRRARRPSSHAGRSYPGAEPRRPRDVPIATSVPGCRAGFVQRAFTCMRARRAGSLRSPSRSHDARKRLLIMWPRQCEKGC
jgi:hypothetical protein